MTHPFEAQYAAVRESGAGLMDLSLRGRILVSGSDALMFLNGLITNDMKTLAPNSWMPAAFVSVQGRLIAAVRVIRREVGYLIDTEEATREPVLKLLERFTLAGDFRVTDLTESTAQISVQGKDAANYILFDFRRRASELERQAVLRTRDGTVDIIRATHTAEDGFDLFLDDNTADELWRNWTAERAIPIEEDVPEVLRIEAGIPRFGIDIDDTTIISETNLEDAVSDTKGCYVGQEIIVRIKHRGHVAKKMTGISLQESQHIDANTKILSIDDQEIGRVTSSTFSPSLNRTIAIGYVKYDYLAAGRGVKVVSAKGEFPASITDLPFIRGSWYDTDGDA